MADPTDGIDRTPAPFPAEPLAPAEPLTLVRPLAVSPAVSEPRLRLALGLARRGVLDGGWWPRSRDAATQLTELAADLIEPLGMITRLAVDATDWDDIPRRIKVGDRAVKVGWFPDLSHMIIVTRGRQDQFMLLVVPPDATPHAAQAALEWAAAGTGSAPPREILSGCDISADPARYAGGDAATATRPDRDPPPLRLVPDRTAHERSAVTTGESGRPDEPPETARWADDGGPRLTTGR
ncbi:DUF5994 family protein [Actinomadura sp. HBU206391]|uniref:DUF5994 family protein n=1 Tax=Actinomadura sp. HBU206391 TaxID=2731692 RepID=UPI00164F5B58|nr:DUF5994 family protein [Actinomadura sp. HBU206391]MBC6460322.1 hypothetical protein [Actinomadura sp. HBU206391]